MRLLQRSNDTEFSHTREYVGHDTIPPYAILSHTWGSDDEEVTFEDIRNGTGRSKPGYTKLRFCGRQAEKDGLQYFWVDTCCIDKSSSTELSEAINSMFRWYQGASRCYVYLSDVFTSPNQPLLLQDFNRSRWFTRGWTLQELLAPKQVDFFSAEGNWLGDKISLLHPIHSITRISVQALEGGSLSAFTVEERMSWAEGRETRREEDAAYSLLGIFDIYIPLIYGEGRKRATVRLLKAINEALEDEPSASSSILSSEGLGRNHERTSTVPSNVESASTVPPSTESHLNGDGVLKDHLIDVAPMWPGVIVRSGISGVYLRQRDMISDAAYYGEWDKVMEQLEVATSAYGENWVNAVRIRPEREVDRVSFWTPLHQAAALGAPLNVVKNLIQNGALRTLRTRRDGNSSDSDLTATEIARKMGHLHLAAILAPVIYHPVPHKTLVWLQEQFHEMIRGDYEQASNLVLPELEALTELKVPEMWFPLQHQSARECTIGYRYRLEGRVLVVTKYGIDKTSPTVYSIS